MGGFGGMMNDPANNIYMGYEALNNIVEGSDEVIELERVNKKAV